MDDASAAKTFSPQAQDIEPGSEEPGNASPPALAPANEQERPLNAVGEEEHDVAGEAPSNVTPSKAQAVLSDTQKLFQRLTVQARDAAVVAGQKLDQAAISLGAAVDNYALQVCWFCLCTLVNPIRVYPVSRSTYGYTCTATALATDC
jgi:hypothetical protein